MSACKRPNCGKDITWGETEPDENGRTRKIPLDPSAPVYRIIRHDAAGDPVIRRDENAMVSHFVTCPDSNQFSGGKKK